LLLTLVLINTFRAFTEFLFKTVPLIELFVE